MEQGVVTEIATLANEKTKTTVLDVAGERSGTYYLVGPDGKAEKHVADPGWHSEALATPAELRKFIEAEKAEGSAVFFDDTSVVFVCDLNDRRDRAACALIQTPQYKWLCGSSGGMLSQSELVRVLRIVFRNALPPDGALLSLVRNLKFNTTADGAVNIQHGRESLGKSVLSQVTGEAAMPEEVTLIVPIFENHPFATSVVCAIEVFSHEQKFKLTPYPLEVRKAMDAALANIEDLLSEPGLPPVYRGQP